MERASRTLQQIMNRAIEKVPDAERPAVAWSFAAGDKVAARTRVLDCRDNVLRVQVPDATWRAQLMAMTPQIMTQLRQFVPIVRIEFQLARPQDERRAGTHRYSR
ncbi:MAG: DUF721 domain-containing protein [Acidobacteriota bacterium]|nr:DUF721 domain-containing protein [Acidobacteriota bacterium]